MNKITDKLIKSTRILVVLFAVFSLVVSGAGAAERLFSAYDEEAESVESGVPIGPVFEDSPSEETPHNMEPGGKPFCEQSGWIVASLTVNKSNSDRQTDEFIDCLSGDLNQSVDLSPKASLLASVSLVSSDLGQTFTLVGSKPSGTS